MAEYLIFFNQQWVGDHPMEWYLTRVEPSMAVVKEMEEAGVLIYAGGLEEDLQEAFHADATSGEILVSDGPYIETKEYLGGLTIVDVPDEALDETLKKMPEADRKKAALLVSDWRDKKQLGE